MLLRFQLPVTEKMIWETIVLKIWRFCIQSSFQNLRFMICIVKTEVAETFDSKLTVSSSIVFCWVFQNTCLLLLIPMICVISMWIRTKLRVDISKYLAFRLHMMDLQRSLWNLYICKISWLMKQKSIAWFFWNTCENNPSGFFSATFRYVTI